MGTAGRCAMAAGELLFDASQHVLLAVPLLILQGRMGRCMKHWHIAVLQGHVQNSAR